MNALQTIIYSGLWYVLCAVSLLFVVGTEAILYRAIAEKRKRKPILAGSVNAALAFVLFLILMDCAMTRITSSSEKYLQIELFLFDLPWLFYAGLEVLIGALLLIGSRDNMVYTNSSLTSETIRQAVDLLPEGIVICSRDGTVRLSNLKMNDLAKALSGDLLVDGRRLWSIVAETGKEQGGKYLVRLPSKEVWLFEKENFTADEQVYTQITAADVTERYRIIDELADKNEHLLDIRRRMKAVTDLSGDMFVAQEEADARAALHNQLGQVLLMGRHYIRHPDVTDPKVVYAATRQMNLFLLGESEEPYQGEEDPVTTAIAMANSIGVRVVFETSGATRPESAPAQPASASAHSEASPAQPASATATASAHSEASPAQLPNPIKELLAQAITECAANTVKHAEGDTITVSITAPAPTGSARHDSTRHDSARHDSTKPDSAPASGHPSETAICITNNGKPPQGEIVVSGGLLSLRRRVVEAGGTMHLESAPAFVLTLHFPK